MKVSLQLSALALVSTVFGATVPPTTTTSKATSATASASGPQFSQGQPIDGKGKGAPLLGMTTTPSGDIECIVV